MHRLVLKTEQYMYTQWIEWSHLLGLHVWNKPYMSRHMILTNWAMCLGMLPSCLVWGGLLGDLPRGPPASTWSPSVTNFKHGVVRESHVPAVFFYFSGENSTWVRQAVFLCVLEEYAQFISMPMHTVSPNVLREYVHEKHVRELIAFHIFDEGAQFHLPTLLSTQVCEVR